MASFSGRKEAAVGASQHVVDVFVREAGDQVFAHLRDVGRAAVLVVVDGGLEDLLGNRQGIVLIELDVRGALDFYFRGGGDDLGVEIARQIRPAPA